MSRMSDAYYRTAAKENYGEQGAIEIDSNAKVSRGAPNGAYVQAWVWVYDLQHGGGKRCRR